MCDDYSCELYRKWTSSEWQQHLSKEQYEVLRLKKDETSGWDKHEKNFDSGIYHCAGCNSPLYQSTHKFDSGTGWPSFFQALPGAVESPGLGQKSKASAPINEVACACCGGHLGHVFRGEGYQTPTDERHCVHGAGVYFRKVNFSTSTEKREEENKRNVRSFRSRPITWQMAPLRSVAENFPEQSFRVSPTALEWPTDAGCMSSDGREGYLQYILYSTWRLVLGPSANLYLSNNRR